MRVERVTLNVGRGTISNEWKINFRKAFCVTLFIKAVFLSFNMYHLGDHPFIIRLFRVKNASIFSINRMIMIKFVTRDNRQRIRGFLKSFMYSFKRVFSFLFV